MRCTIRDKYDFPIPDELNLVLFYLFDAFLVDIKSCWIRVKSPWTGVDHWMDRRNKSMDILTAKLL